MKNALLIFVLSLAPAFGFTQDFSNKGKDFWLAYPAHIDGNNSRMALYISSQVNTTGTVVVPGGVIPFSVTANQATVVEVSPQTYNVLNAQNNSIAVGRGIHITANDPVVVYSHVLNQARSGSSLIIPVNTLGREYTAISYRSSTSSNPPGGSGGTASGSIFLVVAVEDNTVVEITPTAANINNSRPVNVPFSINMNKGDVYQYITSSSNDVTGTSIRSISSGTSSCKPIAVFSGSSWTTMECAGASGGDNLFQQLMPKAAWGKNYVTAPFADRQYDIFRILVDDPTTVVTRNGTALNTATLINNKYYEFKTSAPNVISSDKPIQVVQYMISQTCDTRNNGMTGANAPYPGDPEMIILNPIEQTISDVTVVSARNNIIPSSTTNISKHFFTIIMKSDATSTLQIDGSAPNGNFIAIGTSGYSYLHENMTARTNTNPSHRIQAGSGFIALAYGMGNVESYGYNAGTNVKDLYQFVKLETANAIADFPSACKDAPFKFTVTLPYQATSLTWDFGANPNLSPNNNIVDNAPVPAATTVVDGRTLYKYELSGNYIFNTAGNHLVKITAVNPTPDGCTGAQDIEAIVVVDAPPTAGFSFTAPKCPTDAITFNDITTTSRPIYKWEWDFDNGTTDNVKSSVQTLAAGSYDVKMKIYTETGCVAETTKAIIIHPKPSTSFTYTANTCKDSSIIFTSNTNSGTGTIAKWNWNFGDGTNTSVTTATTTKTYAASNPYTVNLTVENNSGCVSDVSTQTVTIKPGINVDFTMSDVCAGDQFAQFTNSSSVPGNASAVINYSWNFGDANSAPANNQSTVKNPTHKYTVSGNYNVTLTASSASACTSVLQKQVTVNGLTPVANAELTDATLCSDNTVTLKNLSTVDFGNIIKLEIIWDNGNAPAVIETDNSPSVNKTYTHKYTTFSSPASKNITIKVKAYSGTDCISEMNLPLTLYANPVVTFNNPASVCESVTPFQLNANTIGAFSGAGVYSGNGTNASGLFNPAISGTGNVQLIYTYTSAEGCADADTANIVVNGVPVVDAGPDLNVLEGGSATLFPSITGTATNLNYVWTPSYTSNFLNNNKIKNPVFRAGSEDVSYTLRVTGSGGCSASDNLNIYILKAPVVPNAFSPNGDGINDVWDIKYLDTYTGVTVQVFNRYGMKVYDSKGYGTPWNGTHNGNPLPVGTYYYVINPKNGRNQIAGNVTILR